MTLLPILVQCSTTSSCREAADRAVLIVEEVEEIGVPGGVEDVTAGAATASTRSVVAE
jgi:hypothetical protein